MYAAQCLRQVITCAQGYRFGDSLGRRPHLGDRPTQSAARQDQPGTSRALVETPHPLILIVGKRSGLGKHLKQSRLCDATMGASVER